MLVPTHNYNLWKGQVSIPCFGVNKGGGSNSPTNWSLQVLSGTLVSQVTDQALSAYTFYAKTIKYLREAGRRYTDGGSSKEARLENSCKSQKKLIQEKDKDYALLLPGESCAVLTNDSPVMLMKYTDGDGKRLVLVTKLAMPTEKGDETPLCADVTKILEQVDKSLVQVWIGFLPTSAHLEKFTNSVRSSLIAHGLSSSRVYFDFETDFFVDAGPNKKKKWYSSLRGDKWRNLIVINHHEL